MSIQAYVVALNDDSVPAHLRSSMDDGEGEHCACCLHRRMDGQCGGPACPCWIEAMVEEAREQWRKAAGLRAAVSRVRELAEGDEYWYDKREFRHPRLIWVRQIMRALDAPDD